MNHRAINPKLDVAVSLVIFATVFFAYYATSARLVTTEDAGSFMLAATFWGVNHAPGYPLYSLTTSVATWLLSVLEPARVLPLYSAFFASLTVSLAYLFCRGRGLSIIASTAGVSSIAWGVTFWSQANVAEVYTLHTFLMMLAILLWDRWSDALTGRRAFTLAVVAGFGLAHHYPLFILSAGVFALLSNAPGLLALTRYWQLVAAGLALGLSPYMYLLLQAIVLEPFYNLGQIHDIGTFADHVLRTHYQSQDQQGGGFQDRFVFLELFFVLCWNNFRLLLLFLVPASLLLARQDKALLATTLLSGLTLIVLLSFEANELNLGVFRVYFISSFTLLGICIAYGIHDIQQRLPRAKHVLSAALVFALTGQAYWNAPDAAYANNQFVAGKARDLLTTLPEDSLLIVCGDDILPIYYTQQVEGVRRDVKIFDQFGLLTDPFGDETFQELLDGSFKERRRKHMLSMMQASSNNFITCSDLSSNLGVEITPYFLVWAVSMSGASQIEVREWLDQAVNQIKAEYPKNDAWHRHEYRSTLSRVVVYGLTTGQLELDEVATILAEAGLGEKTLSHIASELVFARAYDISYDLFRQVEAEYGHGQFTGADFVNYCQMLGSKGEWEDALPICEIAYEDHNSCNPSVLQVIDLGYQNTGRPERAALFRQTACK